MAFVDIGVEGFSLADGVEEVLEVGRVRSGAWDFGDLFSGGVEEGVAGTIGNEGGLFAVEGGAEG